MQDFENILHVCRETTAFTRSVIDDFLIYYTASRNNLEKEINKAFGAFRHITREFKPEWLNMLKSQYIAHRIFQKEGLIKKLLNHSAVKDLGQKELKYLEFQSEHPWRFSFSMITANPSEDFYQMIDVFRDEEYLLYSPGITRTLEDQDPILWLNMIAFNGSCYQSYGPIGTYNSFEPDDIYFFATELDPGIQDDASVSANIESDPVPYMMLLSGSANPRIFNKKDQIIQVIAEYKLKSGLNIKNLRKSFVVEYNQGIYLLSLKRWVGPPHYSRAYYDENEKLLLLSSMTDRGFGALTGSFKPFGYDFTDDPSIRVSLQMISAASEILNRKITLNRYEHLFENEKDDQEDDEIEKLNTLLQLALPEINTGRKPDIKTLATQAGVDEVTAREIISHITGKLNKPASRKKQK